MTRCRLPIGSKPDETRLTIPTGNKARTAMQFLGFLCPLFVLFLGLGLAGLLGYFAMRAKRRAAVLGDTPVTKIDLLRGSPGKVRKIKGRVIAQEDLIRSPLARRDCVYYRFLVQEQHTSHSGGKHGGTHTHWVNVVDDRQAVAVVVEDDTGQVNINLEDAEVVLKSAKAQESGLFRDPPERLRRLLSERYGKSTKGLLFNKTMRYTESVLEDGARIIIVGEVANGKRGPILRKHQEVGLVVSDKSDQQLTSHYQGRATWLWIFMGAVLFFTLIATVVSTFFAFTLFGVGRAIDNAKPPAPSPTPGLKAPEGFPAPPALPAGFPQPPAPANPTPQQPKPHAARPADEPPLPRIRTAQGMQGPESYDEAIEWLRGGDLQQQIWACESLAKAQVYPRRQAEVARELENLLQPRDLQGRGEYVAGKSMEALTVWATPEQATTLLRLMERDGPLREQARDLLVRLKEPRAVEPIAALLTNFFTREKAARALIDMGPMVEPEVRKYLTHQDQAVREKAAFVLEKIGKTGKDDAFDAALAGLKGKDGGGQRKALQWFQSAKPDHPRRAEAAQEMARLLEEGDPFSKGDAAKALATWATPEQVPALVAALQQGANGGQHKDILRALGQTKDKRAVPALAGQLGSFFNHDEAEKALVAIGSEGEEDLVKALPQLDVKAQTAALRVLRQVGTRKSLPALKAVLGRARLQYGSGSEVARAALAAVTAISPREDVPVRPADEPPMPKVETRRGPMGPESFDQAILWLRGNQVQQLVTCSSLAQMKVYPRRQAEVARELENLLNGRDKLVAGKSMDALVVWATAEQVPSLLKALDSENVFIREHAQEALVRLKEPRAVEPIAKQLTSFSTRGKAAQALIDMGPMVESEVRKYLTHQDQAVREKAAFVLEKIGKTGKDDAFDAALAGLKGKDGGGQRKALQWFQSAKPDHPRRAEAAQEMARVLKEGGPFEKGDAAKALATWATAEELPTLITVLRRDQNGFHQKDVIRALAQTKDKRAVPILVEQLGSPFQGEEAEKALIGMGSAVEEEVAKALTQRDFRVRTAACRILREVGTAKSLPALKAALAAAQKEQGTGPQVAAAAQAAITDISAR